MKLFLRSRSSTRLFTIQERDNVTEMYVQKQYEIVSEEDCHVTWRGVILHPDAVTRAGLRCMNLWPEEFEQDYC